MTDDNSKNLGHCYVSDLPHLQLKNFMLSTVITYNNRTKLFTVTTASRRKTQSKRYAIYFAVTGV